MSRKVKTPGHTIKWCSILSHNAWGKVLYKFTLHEQSLRMFSWKFKQILFDWECPGSRQRLMGACLWVVTFPPLFNSSPFDRKIPASINATGSSFASHTLRLEILMPRAYKLLIFLSLENTPRVESSAVLITSFIKHWKAFNYELDFVFRYLLLFSRVTRFNGEKGGVEWFIDSNGFRNFKAGTEGKLSGKFIDE